MTTPYRAAEPRVLPPRPRWGLAVRTFLRAARRWNGAFAWMNDASGYAGEGCVRLGVFYREHGGWIRESAIVRAHELTAIDRVLCEATPGQNVFLRVEDHHRLYVPDMLVPPLHDLVREECLLNGWREPT